MTKPIRNTRGSPWKPSPKQLELLTALNKVGMRTAPRMREDQAALKRLNRLSDRGLVFFTVLAGVRTVGITKAGRELVEG